MMPESAEQRCGNCDAIVTGPYCHACGQRVEDPLRSLRDFARDVAGDVFHLDSRAVRTARDLFLRPGLLTATYRAGARVRYIQPLQLYLLAAALFFVVNSFRPVVEFNVARRQVSSYLGPVSAGGSVSDEQLGQLAARGMTLPLFAERFRSRVNSNLPTFLIGSVLLFTLSFALLYRRTSLLAHAVFVLHWTSFYLLVMAFDQLMPRTSAWNVVHGVVWLATVLWFAVALKRVYAQSWLLTTAKALLLTVVFNLFLALWVTSVIWITFETILK